MFFAIPIRPLDVEKICENFGFDGISCSRMEEFCEEPKSCDDCGKLSDTCAEKNAEKCNNFCVPVVIEPICKEEKPNTCEDCQK